MRKFVSNGGLYAVECCTELETDVRAYANSVETIVPALMEVFSPLKPSFERFLVIFGSEGPCYRAGGRICLKANMDLHADEHRFGGLFHETVHGFVEKFIHRPHGINVHPPEALAIILQVAALYKVNTEWASRYRNGHGASTSVCPWLRELGRIYDEAGIEPIRAIYKEMGESPTPVFRKKDKNTYAKDVNCLWERLGFACRLILPGDDEYPLVDY